MKLFLPILFYPTCPFLSVLIPGWQTPSPIYLEIAPYEANAEMPVQPVHDSTSPECFQTVPCQAEFQEGLNTLSFRDPTSYVF